MIQTFIFQVRLVPVLKVVHLTAIASELRTTVETLFANTQIWSSISLWGGIHDRAISSDSLQYATKKRYCNTVA